MPKWIKRQGFRFIDRSLTVVQIALVAILFAVTWDPPALKVVLPYVAGGILSMTLAVMGPLSEFKRGLGLCGSCLCIYGLVLYTERNPYFSYFGSCILGGVISAIAFVAAMIFFFALVGLQIKKKGE